MSDSTVCQPATGQPAPPFVLRGHDGSEIAPSDVEGRWVVLWWFPMAGTSGCTLEADAFRAALPELEALGATVIGCSFDDQAALASFSERSGGIRLATDVSGAADAYGARRAPGEPYPELPRRVTVVIDPEGVVAKTYVVTDPATHPAEVVADLSELVSAR